MPLAFTSLSHGTVPFGFFNIKTDMLLLSQRFFFADQFCAAVEALARSGDGGSAQLPGWSIDSPEQLGDLHGAIAGQVLTGFIGATYKRWPFPALPGDFKQDPHGQLTQAETEAMILPFARDEPLTLGWQGQVISVGDMDFDLPGLGELVLYVDRGGYPRWQDERRPAYVARMMAALQASESPFLP